MNKMMSINKMEKILKLAEKPFIKKVKADCFICNCKEQKLKHQPDVKLCESCAKLENVI